MAVDILHDGQESQEYEIKSMKKYHMFVQILIFA